MRTLYEFEVPQAADPNSPPWSVWVDEIDSEPVLHVAQTETSIAELEAMIDALTTARKVISQSVVGASGRPKPPRSAHRAPGNRG